MIMIIAIIYIFLSYVTFDQQLKNYFQKIFRPPLKNSTLPFLLIPPPKNSKSASPPFLPTMKIFQALKSL